MPPVAATDTEYVSRDTFWNWAAGSNGAVKQVINFVGGLGTCSKSEDTYHHASSYFKEYAPDGETRYDCICDYCGDRFLAYEKDLQQSYEAQVEELPGPTFDSEGKYSIYARTYQPGTAFIPKNHKRTLSTGYVLGSVHIIGVVL